MRRAKGHKTPFPILADESNQYFKEYSIEGSIGGVLKGILQCMPTLMKSMLMGYVGTTMKDSMTTMPA